MKTILILFTLLFCFVQNIFCQITLEGPQCVTAAVVYQYKLNGNLDSSSTIQVCLTGGMFADSSVNCKQISAEIIRVAWSNNQTGTITVSSDNGSASLSVAVTDLLNGSVIDSVFKKQVVDSMPATITCLPASGGSCSPNYIYQWEQSSNCLSWEDVPNATNINLVFSSPIYEPLFYRRKVIEMTSGTVAYSDIAAVYLKEFQAPEN